MAKSLRSKFKRKVRAIKRVKNGAKESAQMDKVLEKRAATAAAAAIEAAKNPAPESMESGEKATIKLKSMKKADGNYPAWLSQRKVRACAKLNKKQKKKTAFNKKKNNNK